MSLRDALAEANKRHAEISAQIKSTMDEHQGTATPADVQAKLDAMFADLDAVGAEAKGFVDQLETKAEQMSRLEQAERFRTESAGKLPGMGLGGSAAVRSKASEYGPGVEMKAGWIGAEVKGEFIPVYNEDEFGRSPELKATATPEYRQAFYRYLTAPRDANVRPADWDILHKAQMKALSEGVDSAGGFTVPVQFVAQLIRRRPGMAILAGRATALTASGDIVEVPRVGAASTDATMYSSAVAVTDVGEVPTAAQADTNPVFEKVSVQMHTLKLETRLSRFLVADSAVNLEAFLADEFGIAQLLGKDDRHLTGNGVGKPLGITADSSIATVNSGSAAALTADGIKSLVYALANQYRVQSTIVLSTSALTAIRKMKDGDGRYLWDAGYGDISGGAPATIEGRPYLVSDFLDSVAASAIPLFIGDLSAYATVERQGFTVEVLRELYAGTNQIGYQGFARYGGAVMNPQAFRTQTVSA